jgi:subtilisin family serine protease
MVHSTGNGIGIAIVDSGIYAAHVAFSDPATGLSRIAVSQDFTGEGRTDDPYGHGTHVASAAAGNGLVAQAQYIGIAPRATLINLRVLNSQGVGSVSTLLSALNWLMSNATAYNIRVVNMSLGMPAVDSYRNDPLCVAVRKLVDRGIVVVAAAGNNGKNSGGQKIYGQIHSPGNEPSALTVGAVDTKGTDSRSDDSIASYSSRGPTRSFSTDENGVRHYDNIIKPEIAAPGNKTILLNRQTIFSSSRILCLMPA